MKRPPELHNELHNNRCRRETRWYDQVSNDRVSVYVKMKTLYIIDCVGGYVVLYSFIRPHLDVHFFCHFKVIW